SSRPQRAWPVGLIAAPPLVEGLLGPGRAAIVQQRVRILACQVVVKAVRSRPGGPGAYERRRWEVHRGPDRCRLSLDTRVTRIADALHGDPHEAKAQPHSVDRCRNPGRCLPVSSTKVFVPKEKLAGMGGAASRWVEGFSPGALKAIGALEFLAAA